MKLGSWLLNESFRALEAVVVATLALAVLGASTYGCFRVAVWLVARFEL